MSDETPVLSKSAKKREAERLKRVGKMLTERSREAVLALNLPETVLDAIDGFRGLSSHGAKRRQLQLIGKTLRDLSEEEAEALEHAIATQDGASSQAIYEHSQLERWRDELLASDAALTTYLAEYPDTDRQKLRQLIKRTRGAKSDQQRATSARALFRFLRDG